MYIFWYLDYQFPEAWIGRRGLPDPPISHPLISIFGALEGHGVSGKDTGHK